MAKIFLLISILALSLSASAKAVFHDQSPLPLELRSIIAAVISYNCNMGDTVAWEESTIVKKELIDQSIYNDYYVTVFKLIGGKGTPTYSTMEIKSFDVNMHNPMAGVSMGVSSIQTDFIGCLQP